MATVVPVHDIETVISYYDHNDFLQISAVADPGLANGGRGRDKVERCCRREYRGAEGVGSREGP